jgi:uncharacterized protein
MSRRVSTWIVTEGLKGTENQCLGVAEALGVDPIVKRIQLNEPWKTLSPYLGFERSRTFSEAGDAIDPPWPDLLIASGRKSIAAARYIKKSSGGRCFTVQIQDPRIGREDFDLLVVPEHDPARGRNILVTSATPNRITSARLDEARAEFLQFAALPAPRVAVLIGGTAGKQVLTSDMMRRLASQLRALDQSGHGLMVTTSRRTGVGNTAILKAELRDTRAYIWDEKSANPYFGLLAWADAVIVTSESMSMISEAATAGKPVYIVTLGGGKARHLKMQQNLRLRGAIRDFDGRIEKWQYPPLNDAEAVAEEIRRKSGLFDDSTLYPPQPSL